MVGSVVSDLLFKCLLRYPAMLEVNAALVSSLRGLAKVMQFLVGRMKASVADYNEACLRPVGYTTSNWRIECRSSSRPVKRKLLDNLHGSALYCGGSDRSLSFVDRTRSGIAIVVEDTSDFG